MRNARAEGSPLSAGLPHRAPAGTPSAGECSHGARPERQAGPAPCRDPEAAAALWRLFREEGEAVERAVSAELASWRHALAEALRPIAGAARPAAVERPRAPFHTVHVFLFHEAFPEVPREAAYELAVADRLITQQLLLYDRTLDSPRQAYPGLLFLAQMAQGSALQRLYRLFPPGDAFWGFYGRCRRSAWRGVQREWLLQCHGPGPGSLARCLALARGKTALLRACTGALAYLAGRPRECGWVSRALGRHHAGLVLLDDLEDWREDFLAGNRTFLLARVVRRAGLAEDLDRGAPVPLHRVARALYGRGEAAGQLLRAEACFLQAARLPETGRRLPLWTEFNLRYRDRCRNARRGVEALLERGGKTAVRAPHRASGSVPALARPSAVQILLPGDLRPRAALLATRVAGLFQARFHRLVRFEVTLGRAAPAPGGALSPAFEFALPAPGAAPPGKALEGESPRVPARVQAAVALTAALRQRLHGPSACLLEQIYARGLALSVCAALWPRADTARWLGMSAAARLWCREQEPYLWERVAPFLETPCPADTPLAAQAPPSGPLAGCPHPEGTLLFLGSRFFDFVRSRSLWPEPEQMFHRKPCNLLREARRYLLR